MKREISEVKTKQGRWSTKYVVTVDGSEKSFRTVEKAETYRSKKIAEFKEELAQAEAEARERERQAEAEARERERQAEEARLRAEYDRDPEYICFCGQVPREAGKNNVLVDMTSLEKDISDGLYEAWRGNYEIMSVTPITSSVGGADWNGALSAGAGWGLTYTDGLLIVARKRANPEQPSPQDAAISARRVIVRREAAD